MKVEKSRATISFRLRQTEWDNPLLNLSLDMTPIEHSVDRTENINVDH